MITRRIAIVTCVALVCASRAGAQHDMAAHHTGPVPVSAGQAAFATIAEVVAILKADSSTDWSKVNIDALRKHLIDMDDVVMHASIVKRDVPGGMEATVTGTGRTVQAIRRMLSMHSMMLDEGADYRAAAAEIPNGIRFTVTAKDRADTRQVARIRGLGFAGLLTEGDHHTRHHLALARGEDHPHGR